MAATIKSTFNEKLNHQFYSRYSKLCLKMPNSRIVQ